MRVPPMGLLLLRRCVGVNSTKLAGVGNALLVFFCPVADCDGPLGTDYEDRMLALEQVLSVQPAGPLSPLCHICTVEEIRRVCST